MRLPSDFKIVRRPQARGMFGVGDTLFASKVEDGLLPGSINIGARAVGWIDFELNAVAAAMIAGKSEEYIRELVKYLQDQRNGYLSAITIPGSSSAGPIDLDKVITEKLKQEC